MINKIIIFSENNGDIVNFMKTASSLRLSYMLRNVGYTVMQVHNCLSFNKNEIETILDNFSKGEQILVCISTSFINTTYRKNITLEKNGVELGAFWGSETFNFFSRMMPLAKRFKFPVIMGGWEIAAYKHSMDNRFGWGFDYLDKYVDYYITKNDIDVVLNICNDKDIVYKNIHGSKLVEGNEIKDYSDCSSAPILSDMIMPGESLSTEIAAGCIFSCQFCNYGALGKKKQEFMRTYESLERELISNYENHKTTMYLLSDNIMNDYDEKLKYLIKIREKTGIDIRWSGYVRLDTIKKKEQAQLLLDSGIAGATFGIESLKKEAGPSIGKMTEKDRLLKSFEIFRGVIGDNVVTTGSFISGLPTETPDELIRTYEWLQSAEGKHYLDSFTFTSLQLYENQETKNDINISRNDPFGVYQKTDDPGVWTSPWGESTTFMALAKKFNADSYETRSNLRAFTLPFIHNLGLTVDKSVKIIRTLNPKQIDSIVGTVRKTNQTKINNYKKLVIDGVTNND